MGVCSAGEGIQGFVGNWVRALPEEDAILKSDIFNTSKGHHSWGGQKDILHIKDTPEHMCPCGYTLSVADTLTVERDSPESPHT